MTEHLRGHSTSDAWLPAGLFDSLDAVRDEHLRLREQVASEIAALKHLDAKFKAEDENYAEQLRQAHRDGRLVSIEDKRTPPEERGTAHQVVEGRLWAGVQVLAEVTNKVIQVVRASEDEWLSGLRTRLDSAREKRDKAERLLAEARAEAFTIHRWGQWIQQTADDGAFGRQPAPRLEPPPERLAADALAGSLERPWHKQKPWNRDRTGAAA